MLTIPGDRMAGSCDGLSRRSFLRVGALGAALTLADMLRLRAARAETLPRRATSKQEDVKVRSRYGAARQFLMARRLVEAGVGCVTLSTPQSWDTHENHFARIRSNMHLPFLDTAVSALVEDLHRLGLNEDVVVLVWGEFGRTPRVNRAGGRDHWPGVMSCVVAGGGLRMGQVIGATTARGEEAREGRYSVQNVLATIYHVLGIDPATTFPDRTGRPLHLLSDRDTVRELL
jgi:uncharacterized protein (DUF1501 family)